MSWISERFIFSTPKISFKGILFACFKMCWNSLFCWYKFRDIFIKRWKVLQQSLNVKNLHFDQFSNSCIKSMIQMICGIFNLQLFIQEPVENWPIVDCLISFHSKGFPLDKAIQYASLRNPFIINNLTMQYDIQVRKNNYKSNLKCKVIKIKFVLQDRRKVYSILEGEGIEIPRYAVLDRDSADPKRKLA